MHRFRVALGIPLAQLLTGPAMRRSCRLNTILLATGLFACVSPATDEVRSRGGDTTVRTAGAPRYPRGATLVQEIQIGDMNGADPYLFTTISNAIVANDGTIWILEAAGRGGSPPSVRQFDAQGKFIRYVGRRGAGPGEYTSPNGIAQLPDGRVVVRDQSQSRLNVYTPDGKSATTWTMPDPYSWMMNAGSGLDADVNGVLWMRFLPPAGDPAIVRRTTYVRFSSAGKLIDTVMSPLLPALPSSGITVTSGRGSSTNGAPYYVQNLATWHPSGTFVTAVSSKYAIDLRVAPPSPRLWAPGDPVISIRRNGVKPVKVSTAERTDQAAILRQRVEAAPGQRSNAIPEVPRVKPPIRGISVGADGRFWVRVAAPSERFDRPPPPAGTIAEPPWREPIVYEIFEPTGEFLGRLSLPTGAGLVVSRGNEIWCVVRDDNDVASLRKYRVRWQ
jgi:hypothetical protein